MANDKKKGWKSKLRSAALAGTSPLIKKMFGRKVAKFGKAYPIKQRKVTKEERARIRAGVAPKPKETTRDRVKRLREEEAKRIKKAVE